MNRNYRPPPPRPGTIDDLFHRQRKDVMKDSSLNDIDGDEEESADLSDNDSILAMAKRMDASSVLSDPSFIEGASPHVRGVEPGGLGSGRGDGYCGPPPRGPGPGGLYARDRDLDSIASDSSSSGSSSSSSSSGSTSSSSMERNPNRGKRPMGQPRVGFHNDTAPNGHHRQQTGSRFGGGGGGERAMNSYNYETYHYQDRGGYGRQGPLEYNNNNSGNAYERQDSPEYNSSRNGGKNVRFAQRGQRRTYQPDGHSQAQPRPPPSRGGRGRDRSRSRSPSGRSRSTVGSKSSVEKGAEAMERRRRMKLIAIPLAVIVLVGVAVAIAVVVGNRGGGGDGGKADASEGLFEVALPTPTPTFAGLYSCPSGRAGPVPTRGCLGYVNCNAAGEAVGEALPCPSGTLYDERTNVCNHMDQVRCSTRLPPTGGEGETPTVSALPPIRPPSPNEVEAVKGSTTPGPTRLPTPSPMTRPIASFDITANDEDLRGPITTYGNRLAFLGASSPGDMVAFELNLENYLRLFYSPSNLATLEEGDELKSLTDVSIEVTVTSLERLRRLAGTDGAVGSTSLAATIEGKFWLKRRMLQAGSRFVAVYDQTTTYRTPDPNVSVEAVVSRPFDPEYAATLVEHLRARDRDTFSSLTGIVFLEGDDESELGSELATRAPVAMNRPTATPTQERIVTLSPTPPGRDTDVPTKGPTRRPTRRPRPTNQPTRQQTNPPSPSPTLRDLPQFPSMMEIQGILWLDENKDGLFETPESVLEGVFVNLRECYKDRWKATTQTNAIGQYQFAGVAEGEYYVEFFRPNPAERYEFTIPQVGRNDDKSLDSDVVKQDGFNGQSDCMKVKEGWKRLTNAGYILTETLPPTPQPTQLPTVGRSDPLATFAPTSPRFCAFVLEGLGGNFDFEGCQYPCRTNDHSDCPEGMLCAYTNACS